LPFEVKAMRSMAVFALICLVWGYVAAATMHIEENWRFLPDPKNIGGYLGFASPAYNDQQWVVCRLGGRDEQNFWRGYNGVGWYRKWIHIPHRWEDKPLKLVLGYVDDALTLYINGKTVGEFGNRANSIAGRILKIEISKFVKYGRDNLFAMRVEDYGREGGIKGFAFLTTGDTKLLKEGCTVRKDVKVIKSGVRGGAVKPFQFANDVLPALCKKEGLDDYFNVVGKRCLVVGVEGKGSEVWVFPYKILANAERVVFRKGGKEPLEARLTSHTVFPEGSEFEYLIEAKDVIKERVFALSDIPAVVFAFYGDIKEVYDLVFFFDPVLLPMWPAGAQGEIKTSWDEDRKAWIFTNGKFFAVVGTGGRQGRWSITFEEERGFPSRFYLHLMLSPALLKRELPAVIITGSSSLEDAITTFDLALGNLSELYANTVSAWTEFISSTTQVETSDEMFNKAFLWAKIGLRKCVLESPVGCGFIAGYHISGGGTRPGFAWYFGRDSSWESFAANQIGDFDAVRDNIVLQTKYQTEEGKIYHELSTADDLVENKGYRYPAGDSTPFYVIDLYDYYRWTGDREFVKRFWGNMMKAMEWSYKNDVDGDLLIDNPPAGHEWFDYGEKNMIDLVAIWAKALQAAAYLDETLGDGQNAPKWREDAGKIQQILNTQFWNEKRNYFYDRKLPDGKFLDLITVNPAFPMLWGFVKEELAYKALRTLSAAHMSTDWGVRSNSNLDSIYNPGGYHEGRVWAYITGLASLASFKYHRAFQGYQYLNSIIEAGWDFSIGSIAEIFHGDKYEPGGCHHQGWSESMLIQPLFDGALGIDVDAHAKVIKLTPHLNPEWDFVKVEKLHVGDASLSIHISNLPDEKVVSIRKEKDLSTWHIILSPAFGLGAEIEEVLLNGERVNFSVEKTPYDVHPVVEVDLKDEVEVRFKAKGGVEIVPVALDPIPGEGSSGLRILDVGFENKKACFELEGVPGVKYHLTLRTNREIASVEGAEIEGREGDKLTLSFTINGTGSMYKPYSVVVIFHQ